MSRGSAARCRCRGGRIAEIHTEENVGQLTKTGNQEKFVEPCDVSVGWTAAGHPFGDIIKNPLIISCLAGIAVNLSGLGLASPIKTLFELLGYAAPPVGLLCAGAGLDVVAVRAGRLWISVSSGIRLVAMPGVALCLARILELDEASSNVLVLFHALPTAPSAYILARQLGGDARLMTGILTTQTALSILTLPFWLALLGGSTQ